MSPYSSERTDSGLNLLTRCSLVTPDGVIELVGTGSGNDRLVASHHSKQFCLVISEVLWHSLEGNYTGNMLDTNLMITNIKITGASLKKQTKQRGLLRSCIYSQKSL